MPRPLSRLMTPKVPTPHRFRPLQPGPPKRPLRLLRWTACLAAAFLLMVGLLSLPDYSFGVGVDDSWEQALAHLMRQRAQAGLDYIFTYGPLGYLHTVAYEPDLFWTKYVWEVGLKLAMGGMFTVCMMRLHGLVPRLVFLLGLLCVLGPADRVLRDSVVLLFTLAGTLWVAQAERPGKVLVPYAAILAALALVKFNFLVLTCVDIGILVALFVATRRFSLALSVLGCYLATALALWLATGQAIAHIPRFLSAFWQITSGFNEAMALPGNPREVWLGAVALGAMGLGCMTFDWSTMPKRKIWCLGVLLAANGLWIWKLGFTRHDLFHSVAFFACTLLLPFVPAAFLPRPANRRMLHNLFLASVGLISLYGLSSSLVPKGGIVRLAKTNILVLPQQLIGLLWPNQFRAYLEYRRPDEADSALLPAIRARAGHASVDLLTQAQGFVFRNELTWQPRPVFQSYSAYTAALQETNAAFYRSDRAPAFIILRWATLDFRWPTCEDGPALLEVLRRYHPVLSEKGCLLLERNAQAPTAGPLGHILAERTIRFGEEFVLPKGSGDFQTLRLHVRRTPWGAFRSFWYPLPPLILTITTRDDRDVSFRLVPSMVEEGTLLNPLVQGNTDIVKLYQGPAGQRVKSFRITALGGSAAGYRDHIGVVLTSCPDLVRERLKADAADQLLRNP